MKICRHVLTSLTYITAKNVLFHVEERKGTAARCTKMKDARVKRANYCLHC